MSELQGISVLISVYEKEDPRYLIDAVESMVHQTRKPDEIVIVEDGPLTEDLYQVLERLQNHYPNLIHRHSLPNNQGLGLALKYGVEQCQYDWIARMDSDDIAIPERLELQEEIIRNNPEVSVVGGHISEFMDNPEDIVSYRKVPLEHKDIVKFQKMRSAFNHVTVMFKKSIVIEAGNYQDALYMEDDMLWFNLIRIGAMTRNIDAVLVKVRVGAGMFERRGGFRYFKLYQKARKEVYQMGQISYWQYCKGGIIQLIVSFVPTVVRKFIFTRLLRS